MANKPDDKTLNNMRNNLIEDIKSAFSEVDGIELDKDALKDRKAAIRSNLKAKGVHKEAFDIVQKYRGWDEDKRRTFDTFFELCREAMGEPYSPDQMDLFRDMEKAKEAELEDA